MHTYVHEPTGVRFHHNPDLSGNVCLKTPDGAAGDIPASALLAFIDHARARLAAGEAPAEETPEEAAADRTVFELALKAYPSTECTLTLMAVEEFGRGAAQKHHRELYSLALNPFRERPPARGTPGWAALASFARRHGLIDEEREPGLALRRSAETLARLLAPGTPLGDAAREDSAIDVASLIEEDVKRMLR